MKNSEKFTEIVPQLRLTVTVYKSLFALAQQEMRSVSAMARILIQEAIEARKAKK
jgi:hypothetical protein